MKALSLITIILGSLFLVIGISFHTLGWPDLWNGIVSGPVIVIIGVILFYIQKKKQTKLPSSLAKGNQTINQIIIFRFFFLFIAAICLVVLIIGFFVLQFMKDSEPFMIARQAVFQHKEIQKLSGGIIKEEQ